MSQCSTVQPAAWPIQTPTAAGWSRPPWAIVQSRTVIVLTWPPTASIGLGVPQEWGPPDVPISSRAQAASDCVRPASVTLARAGSSPSGTIDRIGSRDMAHEWTATISTSPRFAQSARTASVPHAKRSCPWPSASGEGGTAAAIVCQPVAGTVGRNRRWSFTNNCPNLQRPSRTAGRSATQRVAPPSSSTRQSVISRPPLITGRAPAAARMTVGARNVPASSGPSMRGSASSYRPSANSITISRARSGSAVRRSRTRSSARRTDATGRPAAPSWASSPLGDTCRSPATAETPRHVAPIVMASIKRATRRAIPRSWNEPGIMCRKMSGTGHTQRAGRGERARWRPSL